MNDNATYYTDLITRYFSGEITEQELRLLSDWMKSDSQNEALFREYLKTWNLIEEQKIHASVNTEQEWIALQAKMDVSASANETAPKVIPLTKNNGNRNFSFRSVWKVAATVTVLIASTFILYFYFSKPENIIVTAQGKNTEVVLPDGSEVSLHAGSQLTYPESFASNSRKVNLKGEAYFKVAHDNTKAFIVASGDARVEVLGTQFNVNTNSSANSMEVVLTSGKVSVYYKAKPQENVILMPGEKAELIADQKRIQKSANTDQNYMAWKTRVLVFDNETLGQVINTLQNVYQTPIELSDTGLLDCRVTASFNEQSLQSVLQVIKETLDLQIVQKGNALEISGKGCR